MTVELLIHAIVHQTTILIAQLATLGGARAPLAQVANQVFLELARELERQGVSRKVSADMFGLGLRTYRRKIQRLSESATERGRSLWEVVLEYVREHEKVTRGELLLRFSLDDEAQVRAVLRDLCDSQLVVAEGTPNPTYRASTDEELLALRSIQTEEGVDELVVALMYREGALTLEEIAARVQMGPGVIEGPVGRLVSSGRIQMKLVEGLPRYEARALVVPLGAEVGWEAAVFDHFKAVVNTITARLSDDRPGRAASGRVGGSTFSIDVWRGHPHAEDVYGTLARLRAELSEQRRRVDAYNAEHGVPEDYDRVVLYMGQYVIGEGNTEHEPSE